jgi:hypothetical protein
MDHNVYRWAASILGDLGELRMEHPGAVDLHHGLLASAAPAEVADPELAEEASIR